MVNASEGFFNRLASQYERREARILVLSITAMLAVAIFPYLVKFYLTGWGEIVLFLTMLAIPTLSFIGLVVVNLVAVIMARQYPGTYTVSREVLAVFTAQGVLLFVPMAAMVFGCLDAIIKGGLSLENVWWAVPVTLLYLVGAVLGAIITAYVPLQKGLSLVQQVKAKRS